MAQSVKVKGSGNIIVQVSGDNNSVALNPHDLVLTPPELRVSTLPITNPVQLLDPFRRVTRFVGREEEVRLLDAWLDAPAPIAALVVTGHGGAGKTRLAIEMITARAESGWAAGFAKRDELRRYAAQSNMRDLRWTKPTLIVVDYAAAAAGALLTMLGQLANHPARPQKDRPPLRLLLLEREASRDAGWWHTLLNDASDAHIVREEFFADPPLCPSPLREEEAREAILDAVFEEARETLPDCHIPDEAQRARLRAALGGEAGRDPLTVMMAAVLSLLDPAAVTRGVLTREGVALQLADLELGRIARYAPDDSAATMLKHLAGYAALVGGVAEEETVAVAREEGKALGRVYPGGPGALAARLREALPAPVAPDLLAGALALRALSSGQAEGCVLRAVRRRRDEALPMLMRLAQDFPDNATPPRWLRALVARGMAEDVELLFKIHDTLPEYTLALRELAAEVTGKILERLQQENPSVDLMPRIAMFANNLGTRLSDLGRHEEALAAAQRAADIYAELAGARPDAFLPYFAASLNNLGNALRNLGRHEEALAAAQRAVEIYDGLAAARPDAFRPDLAGSLNNLSVMLSDLGRREEALAAAQRAADIYAELAAARPDAFLPDLARSLNNLGSHLSDLGLREEALAAAQRAVEIREELATARPDAFRPDLAGSLNNLSVMLSDLGRHEEPLAAAQRAVEIYDELAAARPNAFLPDLAMSLNNLGGCLSDLGRHEEALAAAQRAADIYAELAGARPDAFLPDLAGSLNNLGNRLRDLGRREEALAAAQRAVEIYDGLAAARPDAFQPDLARSCGVMGFVLAEMGRYEEAAAAFHRGMTALREPYRRLPQAHARLMEVLLSNYLRAAEQAGVEADAALAREIFAFIQPFLPEEEAPDGH